VGCHTPPSIAVGSFWIERTYEKTATENFEADITEGCRIKKGSVVSTATVCFIQCNTNKDGCCSCLRFSSYHHY